MKDTIVYWHTGKLAEEYGLSKQKVAYILRKLGAKRLNNGCPYHGGTTWCYDIEDE